jgi:Na+-transporting methylmalonyl-CoA/oxaloacetate decarboxylase gamma subunit
MIIYILFGFLWGNNADILQEGFSYTIMGIICIMLIPHLIILLMGLYVGFVKRKVLGNPWSFWDVRFIKRNKPNRKKSPLMIFTSLPKRIHEI